MNALRPVRFRAAAAPATLGALVFFLAGCEGPGDAGLEPGAVSVRDSAGVVIVEHGPLVVEDSTSWVADLKESVVIGREEGDPDELFGRVAGFVRLPDGRVIVGDGIGPRLRLFAPDGTFAENVGRPGSGPGEFLNLVGVRAFRGDSVVVVDFEGGRWSVLDPDGRFVRHQYPSVRGWDRPGSSPNHFGFFEDGTALLGMGTGGWEFTEIAVHQGQPVNLETLAFDFVRADADGEILARFGAHNLMRSVRLAVDGTNLGWDGLRPQGLRAVQGNRAWFACPERGEIRVYRPDGTLERIVRVTLPEAEASPADVVRARVEASRAWTGDAPTRAFESLARATPLPERLPAFSSLAVDPSGYLWLRPYPTGFEGEDGGARWYIFDAEGVFVRALRLPSTYHFAGAFPSAPPFLVLGDDVLLARHSGDLGVETVRLIPLRKD